METNNVNQNVEELTDDQLKEVAGGGSQGIPAGDEGCPDGTIPHEGLCYTECPSGTIYYLGLCFYNCPPRTQYQNGTCVPKTSDHDF